jgi:hypothetical protein
VILSELIGAPVFEGADRVGRIADLRFVLDDAGDDGEMPIARLYGVLVGRRSPASFLGYERAGVGRPWPVAQILRWRERGSFLVLWADVEQVSPGALRLRPGARRWSSRLPSAASNER